MWPKNPSVKFLIETFSKARVIKAAPANPYLNQRQITDQDARESMVRKYAK